MKNSPLITIIVAVLNNAKLIERCLKSIATQTHSQKELIVMDGGSTDGTLEIINANRNKIICWESKPDQGIYNAWNKAIKNSNGEWICFLGSDDYFWNENVLTDLSPYLKKAKDYGIRVVYGQMARVNRNGQIVKLMGKPWKKIRWLMPHGMPLPPPGLMHHRSLFEDHGLFDENFKIAGDYELLLRELKNGTALFANDLRTVGCEEGGIADVKNLAAHKEVLLARRKNGFHSLSWVWTAVHVRNFFREYLRGFFRK